MQISKSTSIEEGAFPLDLFTVELVAMHGDNLRLGGENYYAHWNRSIATHLTFTHWDEPLFNVTPVLVIDRAEVVEGSAVNGSQYVGIA
jgi:ABC-type lipopolysaccharide export system ATPase subunit